METNENAKNVPVWEELGPPKPNARWLVPPPKPGEPWVKEKPEIAAKPLPMGEYRMPKGTSMARVDGDCLEPAIRDGQMVFAYPHDGGEIAPGTPVLVDLDNGKRLIKLWRGVEGGYVLLRYLKNSQTGRPGTMSIPADKVSGIWIVGGLWFNGVPFIADRPMRGIPLLTLDQMIAESQREDAATSTSMHILPAGEPNEKGSHTLPEPRKPVPEGSKLPTPGGKKRPAKKAKPAAKGGKASSAKAQA